MYSEYFAQNVFHSPVLLYSNIVLIIMLINIIIFLFLEHRRESLHAPFPFRAMYTQRLPHQYIGILQIPTDTQLLCR